MYIASGPITAPTPDAPEGGIHDVRAVINREPGLIHELDVARVDVLVPDFPVFSPYQPGPARGTCDCSPARPVRRDRRSGPALPPHCVPPCRDRHIARERARPRAPARCVDQLDHVAFRPQGRPRSVMNAGRGGGAGRGVAVLGVGAGVGSGVGSAWLQAPARRRFGQRLGTVSTAEVSVTRAPLRARAERARLRLRY